MGMFGMIDGWMLVDNPLYLGKEPPAQPMTESACHDRSHFLTVQCQCGEQMHLHESQWRGAPPGVAIATYCHGCERVLTFPPGYFEDALRQLRRLGWIA